jgi:hypothetical protein
MTSLNKFIANVKDGMATTSHFTVSLTLPSKISKIQGVNIEKVLLFCDQTPLPGTSLGTAQVRSYGEFREVPYERLYEPITLSFYVDADMTVKYLFDKWMGLVQSEISRDFSYSTDYLTNTVKIIVQNMEGDSVYACTLFKCYPKAIAPIQLDYAGKDVMKLSVTLMYQYYRVETLTPVKTQQGNVQPIQASSIMQDYDYGYDSSGVIPQNYYTDFSAFQDSVQDLDFYSGELLTVNDTENIGEFTGFGGVFT